MTSLEHKIRHAIKQLRETSHRYILELYIKNQNPALKTKM